MGPPPPPPPPPPLLLDLPLHPHQLSVLLLEQLQVSHLLLLPLLLLRSVVSATQHIGSVLHGDVLEWLLLSSLSVLILPSLPPFHPSTFHLPFLLPPLPAWTFGSGLRLSREPIIDCQ